MPADAGLYSGKLVARLRKELWVEESGRLYPKRTITILPDDVLVEVFDFYMDRERFRQNEDAWHTLIHVCYRWRCVVFASPRRLHLRLVCTNARPVKEMLDVWPALPMLPIAIKVMSMRAGHDSNDIDNVIAALAQGDRVCKISIYDIPNSLLKRIAAMKEPFPALTDLGLRLWSEDGRAPVLPDSFLGGSAPRLKTLFLSRIPFPGLGKLLHTTTDLVSLELWEIPHSGYISPGSILAGLSQSMRLEKLTLRFRSPRSRADRENRQSSSLSSLTRIVLPVLTSLRFRGDSEYLEDIVSKIDAALLNDIRIAFFNQLGFNTQQLGDFINRTEFRAPDSACIVFQDDSVEVILSLPNGPEYEMTLKLIITCKPSDWQLSSLAQICSSALSLLNLERLEIRGYRQHWEDDMENTQWLEVLNPFSSVKDLILSQKWFQFVAPMLQELAKESVTEVLPTLQNLSLQGQQPSEPVKEAFARFIVARQFTGRPVSVHYSGSMGQAYVARAR